MIYNNHWLNYLKVLTEPIFDRRSNKNLNKKEVFHNFAKKMATEILFIVNPISGTGKQKKLNAILAKALDYNQFRPTIVYTEHAGHATELSRKAIGQYYIVIAVGGDGTVNEVVKGLAGSQTIMGIIPVGSGNGLARHLNIPMKMEEAVKVINKQLVERIDTVKINNELSVNVSGVGFDAHVAHKFSKNGKRGSIPYEKIAATEFQQYKTQAYKIVADGKPMFRNAFMISLANSTQFGNNALISPEAKIDDGLVDICIMSEFPKVEAPALAARLFNRTMHKSKFIEIVRARKVEIDTNHPIVCHIDGEPVVFDDMLDIEVQPASLSIIYNDEVQKPIITNIEKEFAKLFGIAKDGIFNNKKALGEK